MIRPGDLVLFDGEEADSVLCWNGPGKGRTKPVWVRSGTVGVFLEQRILDDRRIRSETTWTSGWRCYLVDEGRLVWMDPGRDWNIRPLLTP